MLDYEEIDGDIRKFLIKKDLLWIENSKPFYYKLGLIFHTFASRIGIGNRETECFVDLYPKELNHGNNFYSSNLKEGTHNDLCSGFDGSFQDSTTKSFHHLMKNIGQALNVSILFDV